MSGDDDRTRRLAETEAALARLEERFRSLVERASYAIFVATPEGRLVEANDALAAMLDRRNGGELRSADVWREIFHDADEGARVREAAAAGTLPTWVEARWRRRDGAPITVRLSLRAIRGDGGVVSAYEAMAEDVTDRRREEELLRRSERLASLGSTIAGVAHELNNPLAAIMGFAQILLTRPLEEEDMEAVRTINEETARTAAIVRDLLTLLRREREHRAPVDLNDVAGHAVRTRRAAGAKLPALELKLAASLPRVLGIRPQLEQLVACLLENAEEAASTGTASPGWVRVRTRVEDPDVVLEVEDSGDGIAEDVLSRIWDPFWTTRGETGRRGLGLSVAHGIVSQHGGSIDVRNTDGGGARFTVRLPAIVEGEEQDAS